MKYTMVFRWQVYAATLTAALLYSLLVTGASVDAHKIGGMENEVSCKFPPSLWCSSLRIAKQCQVVDQCIRSVWQQKLHVTGSSNTDDRVQFAFYYEALCPDCQDFVADQLWPTYKKISDIIDLILVPYGNADERWDGKQWQFTCQHGPNECRDNLIQTCAIHLAGAVNISFPFIACVETTQQVPQCAKKHGIDMSAVEKCADGSLGNELEHKMAVMTENLNPPHTFVPWVTLNGEHTTEIQNRAQTDLLGLICETYKGSSIPSACKRWSTNRGCKRA